MRRPAANLPKPRPELRCAEHAHGCERGESKSPPSERSVCERHNKRRRRGPPDCCRTHHSDRDACVVSKGGHEPSMATRCPAAPGHEAHVGFVSAPPSGEFQRCSLWTVHGQAHVELWPVERLPLRPHAPPGSPHKPEHCFAGSVLSQRQCGASATTTGGEHTCNSAIPHPATPWSNSPLERLRGLPPTACPW